jgi:DnaJ-class molecular chaperone
MPSRVCSSPQILHRSFIIFLPCDSKFPNNPEATYAFQKVSVAYNILSDPASKRAYDLYPDGHEFSCSGPGATMGAEETLRTVVISVFNDFLDGNLEVVRTLLRRSPYISVPLRRK